MKKKILISSTILFIIDLVIKEIVRNNLSSKITIIPSFFFLNHVENEGAAFSILEGKQPLLIIISVVILIYLVYEIVTKEQTKLTFISYGLLLAGLLGNLFDRIVYQKVTDYLQFTFFSYSFPIFNLADIMIVIGVFLLLIELIRTKER